MHDDRWLGGFCLPFPDGRSTHPAAGQNHALPSRGKRATRRKVMAISPVRAVQTTCHAASPAEAGSVVGSPAPHWVVQSPAWWTTVG